MGIKNLKVKSILLESDDYTLDKLHNTFLIIDGANITARIFEQVSGKSEKLGGNYDLFGWELKQFFMVLKSCNITPIVVLDGVQNYLDVWTNNPERKESVCNIQKANYNPSLLLYVFYNITRSMGIKSLRTMSEAGNTIAALAKAYDCPVLSQDNNFYFYGVKFIHYRTLRYRNTKFVQCTECGSQSLHCRIYNIEQLLKKFDGLKPSLLPLALELLQDKNRTSQVFEFFFNNIIVTQRIPGTLTWLSKFESFDEPMTVILECIGDDEKQLVLDQFEKKISEFATISAEVLPFWGLDDEKVDYLEKRIVEQRVKFQGLIRDSTEEKDNSTMDVEAKINDIEFTGEMIVADAPVWWCRDFFTTAIPKGIVIKLLIHYLRVSRSGKNEPFHALYGSEIPMITALSELLISTMESKEYVLNLPLIDRNNEIRSIKLTQWPVDLGDFRKLFTTYRRHLIHETLGIKNGTNIQNLPEEWRLYVATIIYWMKRKCEIEKTKTHLFSLLFTMLFGIIDEKIDFYRRMPNDSGFVAGIYRTENESKAYNDLNVTRRDCIAAAKFFRPHSTMTDAVFDRIADCQAFEATYWEFQKLLQFTLQLNALLDCPYIPTPIHELYNGTLLYNMFTTFSETNNIDECVARILKTSPGLISVFKLLKDIVSQELDESTLSN